MYRNTYLLVIVLAIIATLVVGINIGKRSTITAVPDNTSQLTALSLPPQAPESTTNLYTDTICGFSVEYPKAYKVMEDASGSAVLNNAANSDKPIALTCESTIPNPRLTPDKIEPFTVTSPTGATIAAKLYHNTSDKDGTKLDAVIFRNSGKNMDVFIAGYGDVFNALIKTIKLLP